MSSEERGEGKKYKDQKKSGKPPATGERDFFPKGSSPIAARMRGGK